MDGWHCVREGKGKGKCSYYYHGPWDGMGWDGMVCRVCVEGYVTYVVVWRWEE